jgi:hypothetical protein
LTISGSNQSPNSIPRPLTWSTSGLSPSGQTSCDTTQSPRPRWSSRRDPNQPSSSTKRSTPIAAAVSASSAQVVEVGLEVDGLPRVEHERPRGGAVPRLGALVAHEGAGDAVEPLGGVDEHDARCPVGLPRREPDLTGGQRLTTTEHGGVGAGTLGQALDEVFVVAAPGDVGGPHLSGAEAETGGAERP